MLSKQFINSSVGLLVVLALCSASTPSLALSPIETISSNSTIESNRAAAPSPPHQSHATNSMEPMQRRSLDLLMQNYQQCFAAILGDYSHPSLFKTLAVTIYENHDAECGGDPHTFPRRASYLIDRYGRIFKQNDVNNTLDLQYQFNEIPTVISNPAQFQHPTKSVLEKFGLHLYKLEKRAADTFVIFYVLDAPILTNEHDSKIATSRQQLFEQLLIANGGWDFMLRSEDGHEYYVEGSRRKIIDVSSYQK